MVINQFSQPVGEPLTDWQAAKRPTGEMLEGRFCQLKRLEPQRDHPRYSMPSSRRRMAEIGRICR